MLFCKMRGRGAALTALPLVLLLLGSLAAMNHAASGSRRALQQAWASASSSASSNSYASASASTSASSDGYASASASAGGASSISAVASAFAHAVSGMQQDLAAYTWNNNGNSGQQVEFASMLDSINSGGSGSSTGTGSGSNGNDQSQQGTTNNGDSSGTGNRNNQLQQQQQRQQSTPTPTTAPSAGLSSYAQQSLDRHNMYRQRHRAPALVWSSTLEAGAQSWANRCVFEHSQGSGQGSGQGENLAWGYPDPVSALDAYYSEGASYTYGVSQPSDWHSVGHFTQMIWVATTELGCAVASCNGGALFHVCRYHPPGNVQGQYADNVLPPTS